MKKIILFLMCACLLCGCGVNKSVVTDDSIIQRLNTLEEAVSSFLLEDNKDGYLVGECRGEGHLVLGSEEKDGETTVYLLTMYGEYGFSNGKLIKVSGSGVIPAVMKLENTEEEYKGKSIEYPMDGAGYTESIKEMFPANYHDAVLKFADTYYDELKEQEERYAKAYLKEIGREETTIVEYTDLDAKTLTYYGVPVETSNMLVNHKDLANYPLYVGTEERVEDGVRYVYEVSVNEQTKEITYKKYRYENPSDIVEKTVFDKNGNKLEE